MLLGTSRVKKWQDVGVVQVRRDLDLSKEPLGAKYGSQIGPKDFDRNLPVVLHVVGEIDIGHAAGANFALDCVAAGKRASEGGGSVSHRRFR